CRIVPPLRPPPQTQPARRRPPSGLLFFFQAEDGIRDKLVTGVQTCALPIWRLLFQVYLKEQSPDIAAGVGHSLESRQGDQQSGEIGRASCRERGESGGGGGGVRRERGGGGGGVSDGRREGGRGCVRRASDAE